MLTAAPLACPNPKYVAVGKKRISLEELRKVHRNPGSMWRSIKQEAEFGALEGGLESVLKGKIMINREGVAP